MIGWLEGSRLSWLILSAAATFLAFDAYALYVAAGWSNKWIEINLAVAILQFVALAALGLQWRGFDWLRKPKRWMLELWLVWLGALAIGVIFAAFNPPDGSTGVQQGAANAAAFFPVGLSAIGAVALLPSVRDDARKNPSHEDQGNQHRQDTVQDVPPTEAT